VYTLFRLSIRNGKFLFVLGRKTHAHILLLEISTKRTTKFFFGHRFWWAWKGDNPNKDVMAFMEKNYPVDWTYADFASQFHAEFYGE
jgi:hypothetical protein